MKKKKKKKRSLLPMVVYTYNISTWEVKVRPHRKTLPQKKKKKKSKTKNPDPILPMRKPRLRMGKKSDVTQQNRG
jgi:hypothetical protein